MTTLRNRPITSFRATSYAITISAIFPLPRPIAQTSSSRWNICRKLDTHQYRRCLKSTPSKITSTALPCTPCALLAPTYQTNICAPLYSNVNSGFTNYSWMLSMTISTRGHHILSWRAHNRLFKLGLYAHKLATALFLSVPLRNFWKTSPLRLYYSAISTKYPYFVF